MAKMAILSIKNYKTIKCAKTEGVRILSEATEDVLNDIWMYSMFSLPFN